MWINHGGNDTDQLLLTCPLLDEVDNRTSRGNHVMGGDGGISWSCICQYVAPRWQESKYSKHEQGERVVRNVLHQRLPFHLEFGIDEFVGV